MDGYIWRVPTLLGVMAGSALLLFAALVVASAIRRRRPSTGVRAVTSAAFALLAIAAAVLLRMTAALIARYFEVNLSYVEPGLLSYLAPTMFAGFAFTVGSWMLAGAWTGRRALLFYVWLLAFTAANIVNRCSPGWCDTIGFPFPWLSWSDDQITIGNSDFLKWVAAASPVVAGVFNLVAFVAVAGLLARNRFAARSRPVVPWNP